MRVVVGISGASGAPYAKRLLDFLAAEGPKHGVGADIVFSDTGRQVWNDEIGSPPRYPFPVWKARDFSAPFSSGSALEYQAMAVVPCSAGCLSRIAHGLSLDLIGRAADVMLKEKRRLVLCLRETPLSLVHARALLQAVEAGAVVMPASPSFYSHPADIGALVDTVVSRILDRLGIPNELMRRWEGRAPRLRAEPSED